MSQNFIDSKVKKKLTEIYSNLKNKNLQTTKIALIPETTPLTPINKEIKNIPRIFSYSADNTLSVLPKRSKEFYLKLNSFYTEKSEKPKQSLLYSFYKLKNKANGQASKLNSRIAKARVPSLMIKF